jgi:hypothetical protein
MPRTTPRTSQQDPLLIQLTSLAVSFATHIATDAQNTEQIKAMYKILVTGNGVLPLPEIVRKHTEWIAERDEANKEIRNETRDEMVRNSVNTKEDRREAVSSKHQLWIMVCVQIVGFLLLGLEVLLHWK